MKFLASLKLDLYQICILNPLPRTELWDYIDNKYGIFDRNWEHYDTKHLVWNHPNIRPKEMKMLLDWCFRKLYRPFRPFETSLTYARTIKRWNKGWLKYLDFSKKMIIRSNSLDYKKFYPNIIHISNDSHA